MNRISLEFLTRSGCHLCDDAAPAVRRAARALGGAVEVVDIEGDDAFTRDYGLRIPVVRLDGVIIAEGSFSAFQLWWRIVRRRRRR
ncbi:MAG: glutaredoxin family protein [Acidimicrobiia bacterium]